MYERDQGVMAAWNASFIGKLTCGERLRTMLFRGAALSTFAAGHLAAREGAVRADQPRSLVLVVDGVFRAYLGHPSGRQATIQYLRAGDMWGLVGVVATGKTLYKRLTFQAIRSSRVLVMNGERFVAEAHTNPELGWALAQQLASVVTVRTQSLDQNIFSTISVRLAQHLSQLVVENDDGRWLVDASQQELADSVGTVREVVTRVMSQFKAEGLVHYAGRSLEILDLDGLITVGRGEPEDRH